MGKNAKSNAAGRSAGSAKFTLGWQGINKLNAVEGIHLSDSSREMFAGFERDGTSAKERRRMIAAKHSKQR
jgi:hypothetical protein